ncbi:MAG: hypothetical protein Q9172_002801 [Xanthocarpia lactea]
MEKLAARQKRDPKDVAPHQDEARTATGDLRSRIRSLFAWHDEERPPKTPCPTPAGARTTTNSEEQEFGSSTAMVADSRSAHSRLSSFRTANPDLFANNYDGAIGWIHNSSSDGPRRRSVQRGMDNTIGSEGDGQSNSTAQEDGTTFGLSRGRGSLKEHSKQPDINQPRRVKSTTTKKPTFPRRSLYNLKAEQPINSQVAGKRSQEPADEPKPRINHVPGSFRSEYDASIRTSRSSSPVSVRDFAHGAVEPLPRRSFAAVSSRGSSVNDLPSADRNHGSPSKTPDGIDANKDQERPATAIPFLRSVSSSYTLRETPLVPALQENPLPQPVSLKNAIDSFKDQPPASGLARAIEASSNQAWPPDLKSESAVAAVDLQPLAGLPSSFPPETVMGPSLSEDRADASPRSKPMTALSDSSIRPSDQTHSHQALLSEKLHSSNLPPEQASKQLSPTPVRDGEEVQNPSPRNEADAKQRSILLGQKSAPTMGQAPPNLTARPHHRSPKVIDDINLRRSNTVSFPPSQGPADPEEPRAPESVTRAITDLEGLLQQALHIAGNANNKATEDGVRGKLLSPDAGVNSRQRYTPEHETSYESSDSSDSDVSSDSSGLDEEQNRTTLPMGYTGRQGNNNSNVKRGSDALAVPGQQLTKALTREGTFKQPLQITVQDDPADVRNVLKSPVVATSSSVDTTDWAVKKQPSFATWRYPEPGEPPNALQKTTSEQLPANEPQGSTLRERRPSKTPAPAEANTLTILSEPRSFSSDDDKEPIAYFNGRPPSEFQQRGATRRRRAAEGPPLGPGPIPNEDVLTPLPSDIGGHGPGSDPKSLDLRHRHHFSIREPKKFGLSHSHRRSPIARDWSTSKKRWVALVACTNTGLMGLIIGIYAGEVPAIQYNIVDEHHYTILGNVVLFIGLAITTSVFWPLPLLYGRKPFTLAALAILMPLQFPQAVAVSGYRTPYTPTYRVSLLLSRAVAGLVMGFANINFIATLLDLFGASLQSINPHEEVVNVNDVRRHGGGMGIWLGIWTWSFIGSIGVGFFVGAVIISQLNVEWGFWITIILTAIVLVLNVLVPEVRRSPYRRSFAEVRTPTELTRRVARGEVMMHLYSTGPKWWVEEVMAGCTLCLRMLKQPGFLVLSAYIGWIYGQIVMLILLLGALTSRYYRFRPQYVGLCVLAIPFGALLAVPFQRASILSRARQKPPRTDSMTVKKRLTWTSHFVRRAVFMVSLPFAGLAYTLASVGPEVSVAAPTVFAGLIGFLSNLAIAECNGIIMETYDTSDLQPGMTGRPRRELPEEVRKKRTNFSSFPRVTAAFAISQAWAFLIAAAATGTGGRVERRLGAQAASAVVAGILLILTLLLIAVVTRFREVQIIPSQRYGTNVLSGPEDEWKPVIIGNPSGTTRRMSILELGNMTRWKEIRRRNRLTGLEGY